MPFVYRYYPTVHEARDRVARGETGAVHLIHGSYLQDWLLTPDDNNWRVDAASAARRVRSPTSARTGATSPSSSPVIGSRGVARTTTAVPERRQGPEREAFARAAGEGELRAVATEDAAVMQFETDHGALGSSSSARSPPAARTSSGSRSTAPNEALAFDQEEPETLWLGHGRRARR